MKNEYLIKPIAYIKTEYKEKFGIPRQSGRVPTSKGRIVFQPTYRDVDAIRGIEDFSHIWLVFGFSEVKDYKWTPCVRPPRLGGNKRVGVFASRSPYRPNKLGMSCVKVEEVVITEKEGPVLVVSGTDLLDNTPIYDIKPYLTMTDCHPDAVCGYADENKDYRLVVECADEVMQTITKDVLDVIISCVSEDPRPSYHEETERAYHMRYGDYEVGFTVKGKYAYILSAKQIL